MSKQTNKQKNNNNKNTGKQITNASEGWVAGDHARWEQRPVSESAGTDCESHSCNWATSLTSVEKGTPSYNDLICWGGMVSKGCPLLSGEGQGGWGS